MAGMATMAPTGTVTTPASTSASAQGTCSCVVSWPKAAAPTPAKAAWHNDT